MGASAPLAKSSSIRPENLTGQAKKVWSMFTLKRKSLSMPSLAEALRGCADALPTAVTHFVNGAPLNIHKARRPPKDDFKVLVVTWETTSAALLFTVRERRRAARPMFCVVPHHG